MTRRLPQPFVPAPKKNRAGVVAHEPVQHFLKWVSESLDVVSEVAPHVEKGLRALLPGPSGSLEHRGQSYADDGSLPGPTPGQALKNDEAARLVELYESGLRLLRDGIFKVAYAGSKALSLEHAEAERLAREERGGIECSECSRWVAQEGNDWIRAGMCMTCYQARRRAKVEA